MENVFRKQYRELTEAEKRQVDAIKTTAAVLYQQVNCGDPRMSALAKTKLEECVMWATKAITG